MASWVITPAEKTLLDEFNSLNPNRDKGADGTIGDASHTSSSDHTPDEQSSALQDRDSDSVNEVHAVDIDSTGPWPGTTFDQIVMYVVGECRKPNDVGKDHGRIRYIIWNHKIYQAKNGWVAENYSGSPDPHTNHAHFSFEYDTGHYENDIRPYGIAETFGDTMTPAELATALKDPTVQAALNTAMAYVVSNMAIYNQADSNNPHGTKKWADFIGNADGTAADLLRKQITELDAKVEGLTDLIEAHVAGIIEGTANPAATA